MKGLQKVCENAYYEKLHVDFKIFSNEVSFFNSIFPQIFLKYFHIEDKFIHLKMVKGEEYFIFYLFIY